MSEDRNYLNHKKYKPDYIILKNEFNEEILLSLINYLGEKLGRDSKTIRKKITVIFAFGDYKYLLTFNYEQN